MWWAKFPMRKLWYEWNNIDIYETDVRKTKWKNLFKRLQCPIKNAIQLIIRWATAPFAIRSRIRSRIQFPPPSNFQLISSSMIFIFPYHSVFISIFVTGLSECVFSTFLMQSRSDFAIKFCAPVSVFVWHHCSWFPVWIFHVIWFLWRDY